MYNLKQKTMKLKLLLFITAILLTTHVPAQWLQKANFPGIARAKSTSFMIGNKIYVLGGVANSGAILTDFWEYDITTNAWTVKPAFPGEERYGATAFILNGKGYISCGGNDNGYLWDLWMYDPAFGTWAQRAGLPNGQAQHENQRVEPYSFVANGKAYLGGGNGFVFMPNSTGNIAFYDLWEYDPLINQWSPKADVPDFMGRNMSITVSINNKGYVGLGCNVNQNANHTSFWEYDAANDSWTSKAAFPTNFATDAGAFVINSELYVVGGVNLTPVSLSNQFYKYDIATDTWSALPNFTGGAIAGEFVVSNGTTAYCGTGYNSSIVTRNDLWQYPATTSGVNENVGGAEDAYIYPNPASENLFISSVKKVESIEIYDAAGKCLLKEEGNSESINIKNFDNGIYNLRILLTGGRLINKRFVKEN